MADLRPLTEADVDGVVAVQNAAFSDLARRFDFPYTPATVARAGPRLLHCARSTPGGAWVSTDGERITGAALAIVREGLWGLSLLVVDPEHQSAGAGRALLAAAVAAGEGTRGGIILASEDARALRAYRRAGFDLRPVLHAAGPVRRTPERPTAVRDGDWPQDRDHCDAASRFVRGAAHGDDVGVLLAAGSRLLVHEAGGFAVTRDGGVILLAAREDEAARELLRAGIAQVAEVDRVEVEFLDAGQQWAIDEVLDAGLELVPGGAIATRGDVGPMRPYVPSGAYL